MFSKISDALKSWVLLRLTKPYIQKFVKDYVLLGLGALGSIVALDPDLVAQFADVTATVVGLIISALVARHFSNISAIQQVAINSSESLKARVVVAQKEVFKA